MIGGPSVSKVKQVSPLQDFSQAFCELLKKKTWLSQIIWVWDAFICPTFGNVMQISLGNAVLEPFISSSYLLQLLCVLYRS